MHFRALFTYWIFIYLFRNLRTNNLDAFFRRVRELLVCLAVLLNIEQTAMVI